MLEKLTERYNQSREFFSSLTPVRKMLILAAGASVVAVFAVILMWTGRVQYGVLYSGLGQEDAAAIVAKLQEAKIPYELSEDGTAINVPKEVVQETRLLLAQEGLPAGGAVGMEMFNETRLGETDFLQHINYQRALQGELERTIKKFSAVDTVRVHLNIPKESLFIEDERPPSASVVLSLNRGKSLNRQQLEGIVHLVASSVEGLSADNITVVDTSGGLLYSQAALTEGGGGLSQTQLEQRDNLERTLSQRITTMLERVVGPDKALARVTAELDLKQTNTNEEIYDPDRTSIRSEQRLSERNQGPGRGASGIPQSTFELGTGTQQTGAAAGGGELYERSEETTNYEITRINRQILSAGGEVKRLTVAVMVDGTYEEAVQNGETVRTYVPRPQAELNQLNELVKNAVGYDEARGDSVVVESVPFWLPESAPETWWTMPHEIIQQYGRTLLNILLIILFFLFVVRPFMNWLKRETEPVEVPIAEPPLIEGDGAAAALPDGEREPGRLTREQVLQLAQQDPEGTVSLVRSWIND